MTPQVARVMAVPYRAFAPTRPRLPTSCKRDTALPRSDPQGVLVGRRHGG
jgi:hypothetical protein